MVNALRSIPVFFPSSLHFLTRATLFSICVNAYRRRIGALRVAAAARRECVVSPCAHTSRAVSDMWPRVCRLHLRVHRRH